MAYHLIEKKRGNSTNLGKTFAINKDGRITFAKEMAREMGFKEGDTVCLGWNDSTTPATLLFAREDKASGKGYKFHAYYGKLSARIAAKQVLDLAKPGRYQFKGMDGEMVLTDCPVTI